MLRLRISFAGLCLSAFVVGCSGGGGTPTDSGLDRIAVDTVTHEAAVDVPATSESGTLCLNDTQCSDGLYCNGVERCAPAAAGANARGCVPGAAACTAMQMCVEATQTCVAAECGASPDADGDGHRAIACGGDDCDDTDPHRFPGNPEVCAFDPTTMTRTDPTHDEDCDPTTFASATTHDGDHDGDSYVDSTCCNVNAMGVSNCGNDCADIHPVMGTPATFMTSVLPANIHPAQTEACNGIDDNCNGSIDEGLTTATYYRDCDGDTYGAIGAPGVVSCSGQVVTCMGHLGATTNTDCDDTRVAVHPGAPEVCDGLDNDCNPATPDPTITCYADADGDGYRSSTSTMQACSCAGGWLPLAAPVDCYDGNANAHPGQSEYFPVQRGDGSFDYDCDEMQTREWTTAFSPGCGSGGGLCGSAPVFGWWTAGGGLNCVGLVAIPSCGVGGTYVAGPTIPGTCSYNSFAHACECLGSTAGTASQTQACR